MDEILILAGGKPTGRPGIGRDPDGLCELFGIG